jgi:ATP-dependent DNA helicase RecG
MRLPLSPCSLSYENLVRISHGKVSQVPQCSKPLFSQQDFTGQLSPQKGFPMFMHPLHCIGSRYIHSLHKIPHLDSTIFLSSNNFILNGFKDRRNPHLIQILSDLKLMEGEGSGYDLVYEKLTRDAKPLPVIENDFTKVAVTIFSGSVDQDVISILDYIDRHFQLTQKEYITLGVVATEKKILSTQLSSKLQLNQEDKMRSWIGTLVDKGILVNQGIKKGTEYLLNPELFAQAKLDIVPSLRTLEPYKLRALIIEDLKYNGSSKLSDIQKRMPEIPVDDVKKAVYKMTVEGELLTEGGKKNRTYQLSKKK